MTAHDDAMPDDLSDAETFSADETALRGLWPYEENYWEDDLYVLNQNEADDYRDER